MTWNTTTSNLHNLFQTMEARDRSGNELQHDLAFQQWLDYALKVRAKKGYLFLIGNGASSSMASHFATDITKNGSIKTHVFSDSSLLSAVGNDYSFTELYSKPLQWYGENDDLLIAISSSGNSENIIEACKEARKNAIQIITLSAMKHDNKLRQLGDLNFYLAAPTYGLAESGHAVILHHWMDLLELDTLNK